jgi:ADP-heptose:LPS heptosyltransferase
MFTKINRLPAEGEKTVALIRLGAWGDMVWASAVVTKLKEDGYHITLNCTERGYLVVKHDPRIDRFVVLGDGELTYDELTLKFWPALSQAVTHTVNLTQSIEGPLAVTPGHKDPLSGEDMYEWSQERRHMHCDVNFMDRTMEAAGYPEVKGAQGKLFFTEKEEAWAKKFRADHPGFLILWALGGSAAHKAYPYAELVANAMLEHYEDVQIVTVGDDLCKLLEFDNPRAIRKAGMFGIRKSLILTKYADLVIGPDSSVVNAASCYDVPKIVFLSSGSKENLTKYWSNTISLSANVPCFPCHKIHYKLDCPLVEEIKALFVWASYSPSACWKQSKASTGTGKLSNF